MRLRPNNTLLPCGGANTRGLGYLYFLHHPGDCVRYYTRRKLVKLPAAVRTRMAQRDALRTRLLTQYEEERKPRFIRKAIHFRSTNPESRDQDSRHLREDDVHCGIFWDIENVRHDSDPPAVVIEAIRDFAGSRQTPIFQAYMSRVALAYEARVHAIYAQLGVTFIQCYDTGKDTADKKIISDMWKFYASYQKSSPNTRIRIILITGDRDFADAIGQLRNLGVEVGILTGPRYTTAQVFDDYTLGIRVLPLPGVVQARARHVDLDAYQTTMKKIDAPGKRNDFVDEISLEVETQPLPEKSSVKQEKQYPSRELSSKEAQVNGVDAQSTGDAESGPIKGSKKATQVDVKSTEPKSSAETTSSPVITSVVSHAKSSASTTEETIIQPTTSSPTIEVKPTLPHQAVGPSVQITLNENLLADKLASPPKESKQDDVPYRIAESSKDQSSGMFHRLRDFFGLARTDAETKTESPSPPSPSDTSSEPLFPTQLREMAKPPTSPLLSAVDAIVSSPSSLRHLTPPITESESLYSATKLTPPTINTIARTSDSTSQILSLPNFYKIALLPSTTPKTSQSLLDHYTRQVRIYKPDGMSDFEIRQILSGWLKIENWSTEELNEASMRRVVRMTLSSAFEIMEVRKREQQIKQEEKLAKQDKSDEIEEKVWYPLTEHSSSTNQSVDRKSEESRILERKMKEKGDSLNVKSEDAKLEQKMDDKQLAEVEFESKESPTKSFNRNSNATDDKISGKKDSADTNDSYTIESPGIQPVSVEQIPPLHDANSWTVKRNVQVEENRAIPN